MSIDLVTNFIRQAPVDPAAAWDYDAVTELSGRAPPSGLFADQEALLKGDQHRLWLRWFIEGLVSPQILASDAATGRIEILRAVFNRVTAIFHDVDKDRRWTLADHITDHLLAEVHLLRHAFVRDHATTARRQELMSERTPPRCYICGFAFSKPAQDAFLRIKGREAIRLPPLVDVLRPRGLIERDIKIEIEHLVPVAAGGAGQDNLRLACGWCNKHKSARVSLYEVSFLAPRSSGFKIGSITLYELPNPFWAIRVLALRGKCQHREGCTRTAKDDELFIAYRDWNGSPNPTNLAVYCSLHDPIAADRQQSPIQVARLWSERTR